MGSSSACSGTSMRSSSRLAAVRCFVTTGYVSCPPRYAYPTASAPRSAIPARRACAASVRSTALRDERLYPAIPHIQGCLSTVADTSWYSASSLPELRPIPSVVEPLLAAECDAEPVEDEPAAQLDDPLKLYIRSIGDGRILTREEEREL